MASLRHYRLCPLSRSIRLQSAELGLELELVDERPWEWRKEFLAVNPSGELPVLETDDGNTICGAYAIAEYLSESTMQSSTGEKASSVFPGDHVERAEVRRLVDWFHGKMQREITSFLLDEKVYSRFRTGEDGSPDADVLRAVRANMVHHLGYVDHLAGERKWLAGERLSFADFAAGGQISVADYLGEIDWNGREEAKLWYARLKSRPTFREILAERVPGTSPPPAHYDDPDF